MFFSGNSPNGGPVGKDAPEGTLWQASYFERFAAPVLARNRLYVLLILQTLALTALALAFLALLPLKKTVPYLVREHPSGRITTLSLGGLPYTPDRNTLRYFLGRWAIRLLTLNPSLTLSDLTDDYRFTRAAAVAQFADWVRTTAPLQRLAHHANRVRTVRLESISFLPGSVALIRCRTTERSLRGARVHRVEWLITLNYVIIRPHTPEAILHNPIGLFITDFTIQRNL
ncbi:MAG: VirB8 family type IV secretion system protein [Gammaproteobacteria bacterium]